VFVENPHVPFEPAAVLTCVSLYPTDGAGGPGELDAPYDAKVIGDYHEMRTETGFGGALDHDSLLTSLGG
jgi:hypothetical protein